MIKIKAEREIKGIIKIRKKKLFIIFSVLVFALFVCVSLGDVQTASASSMRTWVRSTLRKNHVRGTVAIIKNGRQQTISYGYAWKGKEIGNGNKKVVYPACSLQKLVTAAMMVQLINETRHSSHPITQNSKISRWYPELKSGKSVTVGELLSHTSGYSLTGTEINRHRVYSENGAYDWTVRQLNKTSGLAPGSYFYNNSNYVLLAGIISKQTGESYRANFNERIRRKLRLKATYLYPDIPRSKTDPLSYNYRRGSYKNARYVKKTVASQLPGAANMFTTPREYYKILKGINGGAILNKSDFHYMTHLKSRVTSYCGGVYVKNRNKLLSAYGNLYQTHFGNWFQETSDNRAGMIMFLNQTDDHETDNKKIGYQILNHIRPGTFNKR